MKYRELLKAYKTGEIDEKTKKKIEEDIEKQEAISDSLVDEMEESWEKGDSTDTFTDEDEKSEESKKFTKMINKAIRRAFLKMGATVLAIAIAVILFISFGLSPLISSFYYDPAKIVTNESNEFENNQMTLDMSVYSSLNTPKPFGNFGDSVNVISTGYGNYQFVISPVWSFNNEERPATISGTIDKGNITFYDPSAFEVPSPTMFAGALIGGDGSIEERVKAEEKEANYKENEEPVYWVYNSKEVAREELSKLEDNTTYMGYITFEKDMSFDEVKRFVNSLEKDYVCCEWLGVRTSKDRHAICGYSTVSKPMMEDIEVEGYPNLNFGSEEIMSSEKFDKQHMISSLKYMADQEEFLKMFDEESDEYESRAQYVEKNGLSYYGIVVTGTKKDLQKIEKSNKVYGVVAETIE